MQHTSELGSDGIVSALEREAERWSEAESMPTHDTILSSADIAHAVSLIRLAINFVSRSGNASRVFRAAEAIGLVGSGYPDPLTSSALDRNLLIVTAALALAAAE